MSSDSEIKKLSDYIKRASAAGFNTDKILHELLGGGWPVQRAKRAISMYHQKQFTKYLSVFAVVFVAAVFAVQWLPHHASLTGAVTGTSLFEGNIIIQNESGQITQHIIFSDNKPLFCEDGIHIVFGGDEIPFEVQNEVYENGACKETDVVFTVPEPGLTVPETEVIPQEIPANETLSQSLEQNLTNETILQENQTNEISNQSGGYLTETNQTETLPENQTVQTENQTAETENISGIRSEMAAITGFAVSELGSEIKIYYGAPEPAPHAEIGEGVQISYKTGAAPELIVLNQDGSIATGGVTKDELRSLAKSARAIEKNSPVSLFLSDSVLLTGATDVWGRSVNGINITGAGNAVCVIDTGIDYTHPDLGGCFGAGCKILGGYDFVNNDTNPMDDNGHGTHVAGIAAANLGVKGVAPGANLIAIKALDAGGSGTFSNVINGINWCIEHKSDYNITAVSMSLGTAGLYSGYCDGSYPVITSVIDDAVSEGISVIVSTGNNGNFTAIASPACVQNAIATGASTKSDSIWQSSNRNLITDLLAPGENIRSAVLSPGYSTLNGTSMSAPHVAGVVALLQNYEMLKNNGTMLEVSQITDALENGASITDAQSGLTFKRVDALDALYSIAPELAPITITVQSPSNGTYYRNSAVDFNISSNKELSAAYVSIDGGGNMTLANDAVLHYYNTSILNESQHSAAFWVNNTEGDSASAAVSFSIDLTSPSITLVSPQENSVINRGSLINLSVTDNMQISKVVYYTALTANTALASPYAINTTGWTNGTINLTVIANDSAGNVNLSVFAFTINSTAAPNTAPVITSVSILPATAYKTSDLTCAVSASDADNNSLSYFFTWTNSATAINTANISSASFVLASGNLTKNQNWTCRAKAFDGNDNSTETSANITIRNSAPAIGTINPSGVTVSGSVSVNATVTDGDGQPDITAVSFYFRNATGTFFIGSTSANTSNSLYSATWNTLTTADNSATLIFVNATDGTTFVTGTSASNFTVSNANHAPAVQVSYPNGNENLTGSKVINWTASDPDSDALTFAVYYSANSGSTWTSITNSTSSYVQLWNTAAVSNGAHYRVKVAAADARGLNASDTSDADFTISNPLASNTTSSTANNTVASVSSVIYDVTQKFASIGANTPITFVVNKEGIALTEISLTMKSATKGAELKIKKLADKPADISIAPLGVSYQYLQIDTVNLLANLSSAAIKFKVPKSWVQSNSVGSETIRLKRWAAGWISLQTTLDSNDSTDYYYSAATTSFSAFAITGEKIAMQTTAPAEEPPSDESLQAGQSTKLTGTSIFGKQISLNEVLFIILMSSFVLVSVMYVGMRQPRMPEGLRLKMPQGQPSQQAPYQRQQLYYPPQQQQRQQMQYPQQPYPQQRQQYTQQQRQYYPSQIQQQYQQPRPQYPLQQPQVPQVPQQLRQQYYPPQQYPQQQRQQYPYPAQRVYYPQAPKQNFISQIFKKKKPAEEKKKQGRYEPPDFGF